MRLYELMLVISPEADEDGVAEAVQRTVDLITNAGGSIAEQEKWGLRRLAYPIKRFQEGHYMLMRFALGASHTKELERTLIAAEDVLRHLLTTVEREVDPEAIKAEAAAQAEAEAAAQAKAEAETAAAAQAEAEAAARAKAEPEAPEAETTEPEEPESAEAESEVPDQAEAEPATTEPAG